MTLQIRKKSTSAWEHIKGGKNIILSNGSFRLENTEFELTEISGVDQFDQPRTPLADIILYDDTDAGVAETFTNTTDFVDRLRELGYPFFSAASGGSGAVEQIVAGSNITIDPVDGLGIVQINSSGGGGATLEQEVTQTAHGLVVGDWVRMDGADYVKALADTETNAPAIGIVLSVADANTFTYQYGGIIAISGLTDGESYFLQDDGSMGTTAGTINLFLGTETPQGFLIEIGQGFESGGGATYVESIVAGTNITVDNTDPSNPIVSSTGGGAQSVVYVTQNSDIVNQVLDSTKIYQIDAQLTLASGESIIIPSGGLTMFGYGFDVSVINKDEVGESIFTSPVGGSGNLVSSLIQFNSGSGDVFDIVDSDGSHAVELNDINFIGSSSLGEIDGYRQFLGTTIGIFGCSDGLTLSGTWEGFRMSNSNVFGFGASGTLFKEGTSLTFSNRVFLNLNLDLPTGAIISSLQPSNFTLEELFQINSSQIKLNGVIDQDNADVLLPNITANDPKSLWVGNIGLPDTANERFVDTSDAGASHVINWLYDTHEITMTEDCTFTEINLPANGLKTGEITIYLDTGGFDATLPSGWETAQSNIIGTIKPNELNEIKVKFLSTDRYYININNSLTVYPAPDLSSTTPVSLLPSQTQELVLNGSFFTPATIVEIEGQTVNSVEFNNSGQLTLSVTTGATEEEVDITISNGTSITFVNALIINLGDVFIPTAADWINAVNSPDLSVNSQIKLTVAGQNQRATWDREFDITKDFLFEYRFKASPLYAAQQFFNGDVLQLLDNTDAVIYEITRTEIYASGNFHRWSDGSGTSGTYNLLSGATSIQDSYDRLDIMKGQLRWDSTTNTMTLYTNGQTLYYAFTDSAPSNLKLRAFVRYFDIIDIKYIELP